MKNLCVTLVISSVIGFAMFNIGSYYGRQKEIEASAEYIHNYILEESDRLEEVYRCSYEDELMRISDFIRTYDVYK